MGEKSRGRKFAARFDSRRMRTQKFNPQFKNPVYRQVMAFCNGPIRRTIESLKETSDSNIIQTSKNYLIIALVSVFEYYFKNMTALYVDNNNVDLTILFEDKITFKLSELDSLLIDKSHTRGNIIVSSLRFDDLDKVKTIISKLLNIDFFEYLFEENTSNKYRMMVTGPPIDINYKELYEAFRLRHEVVHELGTVNYTYTKIRNLWDNVMNIFDIADTILVDHGLLESFRNMYPWKGHRGD